MWPRAYEQRLEIWADLRYRCADLPLDQCLDEINNWWQRSPWRPYYLHWDDRQTWPDPWELLAENVFCDVARALGIIYTIRLLDRGDCADAHMVESAQGNLVLVQSGKYILNWKPGTVVNIASETIIPMRTLEDHVLNHLIGEQ